jgi:hypothetical protein
MNHRAAAAILSLSLSSAVVARADLADGEGRVRLALQTPSGKRLSGRLVGQLVASGPDTLTVSTGSGREVVVRRTEVRQLERSLGRRSRGGSALRGAAIGLGIGGVLGAGIGAMSGDDRERVVACPPYYGFGFGPLCGDLFLFSAGDKALIGGVALGTVGALLGGIGGAVAPGERWQRAQASGPTLTLRPHRGALGAELSLRF